MVDVVVSAIAGIMSQGYFPKDTTEDRIDAFAKLRQDGNLWPLQDQTQS